MQCDEQRSYLHLDVLQCIFITSLGVLFPPNMRHVAPIVSPIRHSVSQNRAIELESVSPSVIQNAIQIVDPSLLRRMPREIYRPILRHNDREPRRGYNIRDSHFKVEQLGERERRAEETSRVGGYNPRILHFLYSEKTRGTSMADGEGCKGS
jgi:hypothetical protein